jgi:hypothetical protein
VLTQLPGLTSDVVSDGLAPDYGLRIEERHANGRGGARGGI